jgi:hypothetical protein
MELAAVFAMLGLIGNELNKTPRQSPGADICHVFRGDQYPHVFTPQHPTVSEVNRLELRAMDDRMSDDRMILPFFGSDAKQHTNDDLKTRRLEAFTGVNELQGSVSGVYRNKKEVETFFTPEARPEMVWGMPNTSEDERLARFNPSVYHQGVTSDPMGRMQVGPGLGLSVDTPASGGFHPDSVMRVLPNVVNEHNINQFAGTVLGPKSQIQEPQSSMDPFEHRNPDRFYSQCDHPTMATRFQVEAGAIRPEQPRDFLPDPGCHGLEPLGGLHGPAASVQHSRMSDPTGRREECGPCLPGATDGNIGAVQGTGLYQLQQFYMPEEHRENCSIPGAAHGGTTRGHTLGIQDQVSCTQRQECAPVAGNPAAAGNTGMAPHTWDLRDKGNRGDLDSRETLGGMGLGPVHHTDLAQNTQRGQQAAPTGNLGTAVGAPRAGETFDLGQKLFVGEHAPGPQRVNVMQDPNDYWSNFEAREVTSESEPVRQGYVFQTPGEMAEPGKAHKPVVEDYHSPWGVLQPNDPNNPFVHDMAKSRFNRHA